jgi:hypothetical protein
MGFGVVDDKVGYIKEVLMADHTAGDVLGKFHDLATYVAHKGITGPPANEHDGVCGHAIKVHTHGSASADTVSAELVDRETKAGCAKGGSSTSDEKDHVVGLEVGG